MISSLSKLRIMKCKQKLQLSGWALIKCQELLVQSSTKSDWHFFSGPELVDCRDMKNQKRTWGKLRSSSSNIKMSCGKGLRPGWQRADGKGYTCPVWEAQLDADVEAAVQLGTCTSDCRGEGEVRAQHGTTVKLLSHFDDRLSLCFSTPGPPKRKCHRRWCRISRTSCFTA